MNITDEILKTILSLCTPKKVILYGEKHSVCNRQTTSEDFCIILDDSKTDKKELLRNLYLKVDCSIPVNFLLYTDAEWLTLTEDFSSFASSISKKGTVLYEEII